MGHLVTVGQGFALLFIAFGSYIVILNWITLYQIRKTSRFHSVVPLVGAVFLGAGLAIFPSTRPYSLLSGLADYGTLVTLFSLPSLVQQFWETSRINLVAEYRAEKSTMKACLSLYHHGICVVKYDRKRVPGETGFVSMSSIGEWKQSDHNITLEVGTRSAQYEVITENGRGCLRQVSGFSSESSDDLSLDGIELVKQA